MRREIAIGDIHGCYKQLVDLLDKTAFDPMNDKLIFLGDYIDRGNHSKEVVALLSTLKTKYPDSVELLVGNHEWLAAEGLSSEPYDHASYIWKSNGGQATLDSYGGKERAKNELLPFIQSLRLYFESEHGIYVHGGIPYGKSIKTVTIEEMLWTRDFRTVGDKPIICGHTPHETVTKYKGVIVVDSGCFSTGILSAYDLLNDKAYTFGASPSERASV